MFIKFSPENLNFSHYPHPPHYKHSFLWSDTKIYFSMIHKRQKKNVVNTKWGWLWINTTCVDCQVQWLIHWTQTWPVLDTVKSFAEKFWSIQKTCFHLCLTLYTEVVVLDHQHIVFDDWRRPMKVQRLWHLELKSKTLTRSKDHKGIFH